ncbi:hypothetical protein AVEN_211303-1 [Araneus ventricosus]|uniref:Uncharacterized protein n=1 Tax=Araneus ventricosus TaxID=182803 RepID=A0A4Y2UIN7_ARAVE|nr:hypothetical protein AVEN_211303-1 [Araneus ventricosus]
MTTLFFPEKSTSRKEEVFSRRTLREECFHFCVRVNLSVLKSFLFSRTICLMRMDESSSVEQKFETSLAALSLAGSLSLRMYLRPTNLQCRQSAIELGLWPGSL